MSRVKVIFATMALLVMGCMPAMAYASVDSYSVTFKCATSDGFVLFGDESFSVWNVKDADGNISETFAGITEGDDEGAYAQSLAQAAQGKAPDESFVTDASGSGSLTFGSGSYLVVGKSVTQDGIEYSAIPFVLDLTDKTLLHELTSYVKYTSSETPVQPEKQSTTTKGDIKDKATLQTGMESAALIAAVCGIAAAVVLVALVVRKRQMESE